MRILFWNEMFAPFVGGAEIFTQRLGRRLVERGHAVAVVADRHLPSLPDTERIDGIEVHRLPLASAFRTDQGDPGSSRGLSEAVAEIMGRATALKRRFRPDVVHVNFSGATALFHVRTGKAHPAPTMVLFQAALTPESVRSPVLKMLLADADQLLAYSQAAARNVSDIAGVPMARIATLAGGVPAQELVQAAHRSRDARPAFAFLGRLVHDKGVDTAIEATVRAHAHADIKLRIAGEGPERAALERLIRLRGADRYIQLVGEVDQGKRRNLLAESFALLVPSRHLELFGIVAVEGGLAGLPVIATRRGGLAEIVREGETGLLVPPDDPDALSAAMLALARDPERAARMGRAGRERALAEYELEATVDRYEALAAAVAESRALTAPRIVTRP